MSFILCPHWVGRFGNRMHQYAYGVTYAKKNNVDFILTSEWEGTKLFKRKSHRVLDEAITKNLNHGNTSWESRDEILKQSYPDIKFIDCHNPDENYTKYNSPVYFDEVCAYHQSIFSEMSRSHLLKIFEFSDEVKETETYKYWESRAGTYDIAHLRRDDCANVEYNLTNVQGYSVISKASYVNVILQNGFKLSEVEWTSDDHLKKWHKDRKESELFGWNYPEGSVYKEGYIFDWLEDFLRLYFARTIFRAGSSFSWWAAFLSPTAKIYSPVLDKQSIYGIGGIMHEISVDFVEGNHPHWMYGSDDIIIGE